VPADRGPLVAPKRRANTLSIPRCAPCPASATRVAVSSLAEALRLRAPGSLVAGALRVALREVVVLIDLALNLARRHPAGAVLRVGPALVAARVDAAAALARLLERRPRQPRVGARVGGRRGARLASACPR
jgi:hypothetical protein